MRRTDILLVTAMAVIAMGVQTVAAYDEVMPVVAYAALTTDSSAIMIDVKTVEEYKGTADDECSQWYYAQATNQGHAVWTTKKGKGRNEGPVWIPWVRDSCVNWTPGRTGDDFVAEVNALGLSKDTPLYLICRSGGRSRWASIALDADGYTNVHNILEGTMGWRGDYDRDGIAQNSAYDLSMGPILPYSFGMGPQSPLKN